MFTNREILEAAKMLNVVFNSFTFEDLVTGVNIELEHGTISPKTNVTNDNLILTMKIALAHLNEFPDYYNRNYGLPALERYLEQRSKLKRTY